MTIKRFTIPKPVSLPLALVPQTLHSQMLALALNRVFAPLLCSGELDFLTGQPVYLRVRDARISVCVVLERGRFVVSGQARKPGVSISGDFYDFLMLATRSEDSDTLFFQRRLSLEGSTELGLQLKNLLDGIEMDTLAFPAPVRLALKHASGVADRWLG